MEQVVKPATANDIALAFCRCGQLPIAHDPQLHHQHPAICLSCSGKLGLIGGDADVYQDGKPKRVKLVYQCPCGASTAVYETK